MKNKKIYLKAVLTYHDGMQITHHINMTDLYILKSKEEAIEFFKYITQDEIELHLIRVAMKLVCPGADNIMMPKWFRAVGGELNEKDLETRKNILNRLPVFKLDCLSLN